MTTVSVVVPYFDQQDQLDRVLAALAGCVLSGEVDLVVVDDGSPRPPVIPTEMSGRTTLLFQEDRGFRAAAARNLGAAEADSDVIVFLDADMVPTAQFIPELLGEMRRGADLVVGRRCHADFTGLVPHQALEWIESGGDGARRLPDPDWLAEGYARTQNLENPDGESWRLVISACLAVRRDAFEMLGGFDASFSEYGGEDWDLGYRALNCGLRLRHEPDAIAWHDGVDWARRADRPPKHTERLELADRIPLPGCRPAWWSSGTPSTIVELPPAADMHTGEWAATVVSLWSAEPTALVLSRSGLPQPAWFARDRRSVATLPPAQVLQRIRTMIDLRCAVVFAPNSVRDLADGCGPGLPGSLRVENDGGGEVLTATAVRHLLGNGQAAAPTASDPSAATQSRLLCLRAPSETAVEEVLRW